MIAVALLAVFLLNETRAPQPITPLRLFADVSRSGSYVARLLLVAGMMGMFFFLTQFLQDVLGFSPIMAGVAFLPMTVTLFAVSRAAPRLIPRFGPKPLMIVGMLPVIAGMTWLSQVSPGTSYWSGVFPPMMLFGLGMGVVFVPLTTVSLAGVRPEESGAASSMVNVMQQVGGALGLAVLVAVYGTASRSAAAHPIAGPDRGRAAAPHPRARHVRRVRPGGDLRRGDPAARHRRHPRSRGARRRCRTRSKTRGSPRSRRSSSSRGMTRASRPDPRRAMRRRGSLPGRAGARAGAWPLACRTCAMTPAAATVGRAGDSGNVFGLGGERGVR